MTMNSDSAPRKLPDRTLRFGSQGRVQVTSPRWDWSSWDNRVLVTVTPNYIGIQGSSLLRATECRRLAEELHRRADDLDAQREYDARRAGAVSRQ